MNPDNADAVRAMIAGSSAPVTEDEIAAANAALEEMETDTEAVSAVAPVLVLPAEPVYAKLELPPRPEPAPLPELDLGTHEKSSDAKAAWAAACAKVRQQNTKVSKAWEKAAAEVRKNTDIENTQLRHAWSADCARVKAAYQLEKDAYDRFISAKMKLEGKIAQAAKSCKRRDEARARKALEKLEKDRQAEVRTRAAADRAKAKREADKEAALDVLKVREQNRRDAEAAKEEKSRRQMERIAAQQAEIRQDFGDPFAGLTGDQIRERVLGAVCNEGTFYVRQSGPGFMTLDKSLFEELLEVHCGLVTTNPKGVAGMSPAKRARHAIQTSRVITGTGYFTWMPPGMLPPHIAGTNRILNLATHAWGPVAPNPVEWGEGFPVIAKALENGFGCHTAGETNGQRQLDTFLAVVARFFQTVQSGKPRISAGMVLVGDPDSGKGWIQEQMRLLTGGSAEDPWKYFAAGCKGWNDHLAKTGIWLSKDPVMQTERERLQGSAAMKQAFSDQSFAVETRWEMTCTVQRYQMWVGSMNRDARSRSCIPAGIGDKMNIFRWYPALPDTQYEALKVMPEYMLAEHAALRRFLLDNRIPDHIKGGSRYGVRTFCHPEFATAVTEYDAELSEIGDLIAIMAGMSAHAVWKGRATAFFDEIAMTNKTAALGWDGKKVGRALTQLHRDHGDWVDVSPRNGSSWYTINLEAYREPRVKPAAAVVQADSAAAIRAVVGGAS